MADWLELDDEVQECLNPRESEVMQQRFGALGFRDGFSEGEEQALQAGFDKGFSAGTREGLALGRLSGVLSTLLDTLGSAEDDHTHADSSSAHRSRARGSSAEREVAVVRLRELHGRVQAAMLAWDSRDAAPKQMPRATESNATRVDAEVKAEVEAEVKAEVKAEVDAEQCECGKRRGSCKDEPEAPSGCGSNADRGGSTEEQPHPQVHASHSPHSTFAHSTSAHSTTASDVDVGALCSALLKELPALGLEPSPFEDLFLRSS